MRLPVLLILMFTAPLWALSGETKLSCENVYGQRGLPALLKAEILSDNRLQGFKFNFEDPGFAAYREDGELEQPIEQPAEGRLITGEENPFAGNQDFLIQLGGYMARLVLPTDLGHTTLETTVVGRHTRPRSNAVLIVERPHSKRHSGADTIIGLYCNSY